jgi:hypothetical protein
MTIRTDRSDLPDLSRDTGGATPRIILVRQNE